MQLIIGGFAQGKLEYALSITEKNEEVLILDENSCESVLEAQPFLSGRTVILNHLHLIIRNLLLKKAPDEIPGEIGKLTALCSQTGNSLILISDELGCGIVPADLKDRIYRETVGRTLCEAAKQAEQVVRVVCGIPQRIK